VPEIVSDASPLYRASDDVAAGQRVGIRPGLGSYSVAAKKPTSTIPAAKLSLYEKLIATDPSIERKGATIPYTSANGKMFTYLSPTGDLRLRLPPDEREAFMRKYKTKVVVQHGVVMKDFVAVPPGLLARTAELKKYLPISRAFAEQLGAKKTKAPK
jgi:hypothetical protein